MLLLHDRDNDARWRTQEMATMQIPMTKDNNPQSIWPQIEVLMRRAIPEEEFEDWFEDVKILDASNNHVVLGIPSRYRLDYIERNYRPVLLGAFHQVLNRSVELDIQLTDQNGNEGYLEPTAHEFPYLMNNYHFEPLNDQYTFENFVIGESNRVAHAASEAVANSPTQSYNPLFIYGDAGLGKTHLMQAIGNKVLKKYPNKRVIYLSAEQFVNVFIDAIKRNERLSFQSVLRNADVLLIDDIQFLEGKESTTEEFFHTFNTLHNRQRHIVISSDRAPKDIKSIQDRLRSRLEWGLITSIDHPDLEMRMAILRRKCDVANVKFPGEVLELIANQVNSSIRELEGALSKITAHARFTNGPMNVEIAKHVLGDIYNRPTKALTIESIQRATAEYYNIKFSEIIGNSRSRSISRPRQIAMYLSRKLTSHSYPEIGTSFGKKDHTTVIFASKKIEKAIEKDPHLREIVNKITNDLMNY